MKLNDGPTTSLPKKLVFSLAIFFTFLVIWVQGATIFPSGLLDKEGNLVFYNYVLFHDANVHLSLIAELSHRFPPTNFSVGGGTLKNYHYLLDLAVTIFQRLSGVSSLDLYFRIVPVILSVLLCLVIYQAVFALTKDRLAATFGIFFTVFATSWGVVMPFLKEVLGGRTVSGASNLFMTDQMINLLVNPQGQLSLVIFLLLFLLLSQYERTKKIILLVFFSLVLGLSFGVKAYGGIIFAPAALIASLWFAAKDKDWRVFMAVVVGLAIMAIWVLFTIDGQVAGLKFTPFWLLDRMMTDLDKFNEPRFLLLKEYYLSVGSWWRLATLETFAFIIYVVGSLGWRIVGILAVVRLVAKPAKIPPSLIFLLTAAFFSLAIPVFFNQTKKAYDVVQFSPYFSVFMAVMFCVALFDFFKNRQDKLTKIVILVGLVAVFLVLDQREIRPRFQGSQEKIVIPQKVMEAMSFIDRRTPVDSIFLLAPSEFNRSYLWFTSLAKRRTTYSGLDFAFQVGPGEDDPSQKWQRIFQGDAGPINFDYAYIPRSEETFFAKIRERYHFITVFDNSEVKIVKRVTI